MNGIRASKENFTLLPIEPAPYLNDVDAATGKVLSVLVTVPRDFRSKIVGDLFVWVGPVDA